MAVDDEEPIRIALKEQLDDMSVEELEEYVQQLHGAIVKAEAKIVAKKAHRDGIDGLFKKVES